MLDLRQDKRRLFAGALLFPLLAITYLSGVLFHDRSLSAFDLSYGTPAWQQFSEMRYHNPLLGDNPSVHYPERQINWTAIRAGYRLDFNPFIFSGTDYTFPGAGAYLTGFPLFFMELADGIDWATVVRLSLAGIFMYLLLLVLRLPIGAALFGGVIWTFNLNHAAWLEFPQHLAGELWMPLVFAFYVTALRRRPAPATLLGLFLSMQLLATSGYNQISVYTLLLLGIFGLFHVLLPDPETRLSGRLTRLVVAQLALGAAFLVLLPNFLHEKTLITEGLRSTQQYRWNLPPLAFNVETLGQLLRNLFPASFDRERLISPFTLGMLWDYPIFNYRQNIVEFGAYFSIAGPVFAAFSLLALRDRNRRKMVLAIFATLTVLFALYHGDTIVRNVVNMLPALKFGSYSRLITVILFLLSILAAYGLAEVARRMDWQAVLALAGATLLVALYLYLHRHGHNWGKLKPSALYYPAAVLTALAAGSALLLLRRERRGQWFQALVVFTATADLFIVTGSFNSTTPNDLIYPPHPALRHLVADGSDFRVAEVAAGDDARSPFRANRLSFYGLPAVEGYLTTVNNDYLRLIRDLNPKVSVRVNGIVTFHEVSLPLLRMLGVKYLIADHARTDSELEEVFSGESGIRVYRLRNALPRLYCADKVAVLASGEAVFQALPGLLTQHERPVAVSEDTPLARAGAAAAGPCTITGLRVGARGVQAMVSSPRGSTLFVPYPHTNRWRARIDGVESELSRANYALMALPVPPGEHAVEIRHRNRNGLLGAVLQALVGIGVALAALATAAWTVPIRLLLLGIGLFLTAINAPVVLDALGRDDLPEGYLKRVHAERWALPDSPPAAVPAGS